MARKFDVPNRRARDNRPRKTKREQRLLRRNCKVARYKARTRNRQVDYTKFMPSVVRMNEHTIGRTKRLPNREIIIKFPESLDFEENFEATASHLWNIRIAANGRIKLDSVDFSALRHISAPAALVLASVVDRWNQQVNMHLSATVEMWHDDIRCLLAQMGYFELLGLKRPADSELNHPIVFLPFKRGVVVKRDGGKLAKEMREQIESTIGASIKKMPLFEGLSEAITNVSHHAYSESAKIKQWWLSGSFDKTTQLLRVAFYDQGEGIPTTLPSAYFFERIKELFFGWPDSQKIRAAMEVGRSSTGQAERGKGLLNLLEFAKAYDNGLLTIYSLQGMCKVTAAKKDEEPILLYETKDFENTIGGTLIEWSVQIPPLA